MRTTVSPQTRQNWWIDAVVFGSALIAALSGVYFLFLPSGSTSAWVLFARDTWSDLHTWGGIVMIVAVIVHFTLHWNWVSMMAKKIARLARAGGPRLSRGARINVLIDLVIAISFALTAITGIYFLLAPSGGYQGGRNTNWDPGFLFSRTTWDIIHTWAGVTLILAAELHFAIHWRWIKKVTAKMFLSRPEMESSPVR